MLAGWLVRALSVALLAAVAQQAVRPMVTYRALELGASNVELGVVAGSYALLSMLFAAPLGRWVDRLGEPWFLIGGNSLVTLTAIGLALSSHLTAVIVSQALLGLGQVASLVGMQTLIANGGDKAGRDGRFGALTVLMSLAQMVGPTIAGYGYGPAGLSLTTIFLLGAGVTITSTLMAITLILRPAPRHREPADEGAPPREPFFRSVRAVMRQPAVPHAMVASLAVLTTIDLLIAYLPAYGEANGIAAGTIGLLLGVRAAGGLVSRMAMLRLLRRTTRRRLLVQSTLLPAVALLLLPLTTSTVVLVLILAVAGYGLGLGQPLSMAWIADQVPRAIRGTALGVRISGNRLAQLTVPIGVGVIAGAAGIGAIFIASGLMLGASSYIVAQAPTDGQPPPAGPAPAGPVPSG